MRKALLFSGEPRFFEEAWERNAPFLGDGWDVILHAWFDPARAGERYRSNFNRDGGGLIRLDTAERLLELYRPVAYTIEPSPRLPPEPRYRVDGDPEHPLVYAIQSHLLSNRRLADIKRAYEEAHGFRYDLCLRMRYDSALSEPVPLCSDPCDTLWMANYLTDVQIGDQIYAGSSETLHRFLRAYDALDAIFEHSLPHCGYFCVHHMLRAWCDLQRIPVKVLPRFQFGIMRGAATVEGVWCQSN